MNPLLGQLIAQYQHQPIQFAQPQYMRQLGGYQPMQDQQGQRQQQGGGGGGGADLIGNAQKLYNQFGGGMGGGMEGGMVAGEAAPLGGALPAGEAAGAAGLGEAAGAGGMGAAAGAEGLGAGMGEGLGALFAMFSDPKLKTDKHPVGKLNDGTPIWVFKYKGDPTPRIGLMADDVQKRHPEAVHSRGGFKTVDYAAATKQSQSMGILGNIGKK